MRVSSLRPLLAPSAISFVMHLERNCVVQATTPSLFPGCNASSQESVGDGFCDSDNNNEGCLYDGGDCCPCSCADGDYLCGTNGFDCHDPTDLDACATASSSSTSVTSVGLYEREYPNCSSAIGYILYIGDGFCDSQNNNEECGYDGGDCCLCTCLDDYYSFGVNGFDCLDPMVPVECANVASLYPNCVGAGGYDANIDNGYCEIYNNVEACGYDGGDCCNCTCADSQWSCGINGFHCLDPTVPAECANVRSPYPDCAGAGGLDRNIDDGYCHAYNNIEECGYDGGDCCDCTCVDGPWRCGIAGYDCQDPRLLLECAKATSPYANCTDAGGLDLKLNDGYCHSYNNIEECGYDGGDCCACTCVNGANPCGMVGYDCQDPTVAIDCANATSPSTWASTTYGHYGYYAYDVDYPNCTNNGGYVWYIGDAYCDSENNNEACSYDGGDCCPCTCKSDACGIAGYYCIDPTVPTPCANASHGSLVNRSSCASHGGVVSYIGNGYCNTYNNNEECGYDGGDCCPCTCMDSVYYWCGYDGYFCKDPAVPASCSHLISSSTYSQYDGIYPECENVGGTVSMIGTGYCTGANNNEECAYDGGDCCPCTCVGTSCGSGGYNCQDPTVPADCSVSYHNETYPDCDDVGGDVSSIASGYCTSVNNNEECGYDGGDCCPCTCVDGGLSCGSGGYDCQDPTVPITCLYQLYPDCEDIGGYTSRISDGYCTSVNNNEECGYDGGDCCPCSCFDGLYSCGYNGYDCQDPSVPPDCFEGTATAPTTSTGDNMERPVPRWSNECVGNEEFIGDGFCDPENNNVYCEYDGGDCCSCTCFDSDGSVCGNQWYDCQDPGASCSESLRTVGIAILTGFGVFALMLSLYFLPGPCTIKRIRGRRVSPVASSTQPRPQAASAVLQNLESNRQLQARHVTPPLAKGSDVHGRLGRKKAYSRCSAPPLPPLPECRVFEERGIGRKASNRERSVPSLPYLPKPCAFENGRGKAYSTSGFTRSASPLPPLPDCCSEEEEAVEGMSDPKPLAPSSPNDGYDVDDIGAEENKTL